MLPEIWGKHGWNFLHLITMGYPDNPTEDEKRQYRSNDDKDDEKVRLKRLRVHTG